MTALEGRVQISQRLIVIIFLYGILLYLQILMSALLTPLVIQTLPATTRLGPSHVHANQDTVEMERHAVVSA